MNNISLSNSSAFNLVAELRSRGLTISVAESITAGNIQSLISSISGASSVFSGGITAYGIESKVNILDVNKDLAVATNCVSQNIADQMACGALRLFLSDICVSTCGYAEESSLYNVKAPFSFISIAMKSRTGNIKYIHKSKVYPEGDRVSVQKMVANISVNELLTALQESKDMEG